MLSRLTIELTNVSYTVSKNSLAGGASYTETKTAPSGKKYVGVLTKNGYVMGWSFPTDTTFKITIQNWNSTSTRNITGTVTAIVMDEN